MRGRLVAAGVAALMALGGTVAYGAAASQDVACTITDNTLTCPLPAAPAPVTETVTAAPVTVTAPPVTVTKTVTAAPATSTPPATPTPTSSTPATLTSTTATTTTTTAPPAATGFPDATNTGYKNAPGFTALKTCALPIKSNTTYQFCDFGTVDVGSTGTPVSNVTFIGTRFKATAVNEKLVGLWGDNITFDYCSFEPNATFAPGVRVAFAKSYQYGISADGSYGTNVKKLTVTHSDFWGFGNAIDTAGSTQAKPQVFRDNWIHDAAADNNATYHTDGIGTLSGNGKGSFMVLDHNTLESPGNTNGIAFQQGSYSDVTITNNLIGGWGYAVALWAPAARTKFTGNVFSTRLASTYGPLYPQSFWTSTGSVWSGNKWSVPAGAAWGNPADNGKFWTPSGPSATDY